MSVFKHQSPVHVRSGTWRNPVEPFAGWYVAKLNGVELMRSRTEKEAQDYVYWHNLRTGQHYERAEVYCEIDK